LKRGFGITRAIKSDTTCFSQLNQEQFVHIKVVVSRLFCKKPTDNNALNNRDEAYFVLAGASSRGAIKSPRISPPPPEDYFGLHAGEHADNIVLWEGDLAEGESAFLNVLLREQDNAQLGAIEDAIQGVAAVVLGVITANPGIITGGAGKLAGSLGELVASLSADGDQTIGGFSVGVNVHSGEVSCIYGAGSNASIQVQNGLSATFHLTGSGADYTVGVSVPDPVVRFAGVYRAGNDGYALWNSNWTQFQQNWTQASKQGLRLVSIDTFNDNGSQKFLGVYRSGSDTHDLVVGLDWNGFTAKWKQLSGSGLRLVSMTTYLENGHRRFAGAFRAGSDGYALFGNADWNTFSKEWATLSNQGLRLVNLTTWSDNGKRLFAGVYRAGADPYALWVGVDWQNFVSKWTQFSHQGLRLVDLVSYQENGQHLYAGVFRAGTDAYALWLGNWTTFTANWQKESGQGLRLIDVAAVAP
jgi:hypothetical protein